MVLLLSRLSSTPASPCLSASPLSLPSTFPCLTVVTSYRSCFLFLSPGCYSLLLRLTPHHTHCLLQLHPRTATFLITSPQIPRHPTSPFITPASLLSHPITLVFPLLIHHPCFPFALNSFTPVSSFLSSHHPRLPLPFILASPASHACLLSHLPRPCPSPRPPSSPPYLALDPFKCIRSLESFSMSFQEARLYWLKLSAPPLVSGSHSRSHT